MESDGSMRGEFITLVPCSNIMWHEFYSRYVPDPMMDTTPYLYDFVRVEKNFQIKMADKARKYFTILLERNVIGEVYLKHINTEEKSTNIGIALIDDSVKGKGFGTVALKLIIDYALHVMALNTIHAESVLRNTRSQHIMEKVGFIYTHEDDTFKYYKLDKDGML